MTDKEKATTEWKEYYKERFTSSGIGEIYYKTAIKDFKQALKAEIEKEFEGSRVGDIHLFTKDALIKRIDTCLPLQK